MMRRKLPIKAKFFNGLSDPSRLAILENLCSGEKTVNELVRLTKLGQSNASNHLKCLLECGLVKNRREGKNMLYSIRNPGIKGLLEKTDDILKIVHNDISKCLKYDK